MLSKRFAPDQSCRGFFSNATRAQVDGCGLHRSMEKLQVVFCCLQTDQPWPWLTAQFALHSASCCAGSCLQGMCYAATACPDVAVTSVFGLLSVIPSLCTQTHALMELQQQLPLKAVGVCMQLPTEVAGVCKHEPQLLLTCCIVLVCCAQPSSASPAWVSHLSFQLPSAIKV